MNYVLEFNFVSQLKDIVEVIWNVYKNNQFEIVVGLVVLVIEIY